MIRGQQNIVISEKQLSDLDQMTADALKQKVHRSQLVVREYTTCCYLCIYQRMLLVLPLLCVYLE